MFNLSVIDKMGKSKIYGLASHTMHEALIEAHKLVKAIDDLLYFAVLDTDEVEQKIDK